jgi:hypothetical protein
VAVVFVVMFFLVVSEGADGVVSRKRVTFVWGWHLIRDLNESSTFSTHSTA